MSVVVLFDGVCNFCDGTVNFIIAHDPHAYFRFAALQSHAALPFLERCAPAARATDSLLLVEGDKCYTGCEARGSCSTVSSWYRGRFAMRSTTGSRAIAIAGSASATSVWFLIRICGDGFSTD
jgi:DCC1-like thiol-disulfide oxidoreductase